MKIRLLFLMMLSVSIAFSQPSYKRKMHDQSVNFYDVVREAEAYFETHDKGKGSGWKGFQRWKAENESKYYPSGDRSNSDPQIAEKAYQAFKQQTALTEGTVFDDGWRDLGPYDANNVTSHYSPGIGRVESFWVNPINDQHIYMGSQSGGFWRTLNGGATWQNTTDFLVASGVNTIAVNPNNPDSVLINVRNGGNSTTHGVFRSSDGGLTWSISAFNPANLGWGGLGTSNRIYKIAFHPTILDLVFVATSQGLYRSTDGLQTWTQVFNPSQVTEIEFHPTNANIIYAYDNYFWGSNRNVVMVSTDQGLTFSQGGTLTGNTNTRAYVSTSPDCANCVYVASSDGIWKSTNSANTFTFIDTLAESCWGFAVSDLDDDNIVYGGLNLEGSADGGTTFNQICYWILNPTTAPSYVHADLRVANCVNGVFYVGTDGYLAKSTDNGSTWTHLNDGTGIRENYAVGVSQSNRALHMSGSQDNGTSILNDNGWIEWNGGDGMEAIIQTLNEDWMIGSWQYGIRNRTKNGGQTRHGIYAPQDDFNQADWVAPMFFDPNRQMRVFHFSDSVFISEEFGGQPAGNDWQYVGSPNFGRVKVATIANNNSDLIIAVRNDNIKLSQNSGQTWSDISSNLPSHSITDVAFDPNDDNTIVVTYNRHQNDNQKVYISTNLGASWTNITHNLGNMPLRTVVIDHTDASNIYVGGEIGVYYKPMNGNTWTAYNTNLPNVTVRDLEIQYGSNSIKAATWGRGLWDYTLVGRKDFPSIITTNITEAPTDKKPRQGINQFVTSVISYDNTLSSVFVKWSANVPTLNQSITMTNTVDSTWVSQTGIPNNFQVGTPIFFRVYAVGNNNDTTETYRFMYTIREPYCPTSGNMNFGTAITLVQFGTIDNATGKTQPYTNYTSTDSMIVKKTHTNDLTVNLDTDGNYQIFSKAWIDWNANGSFDDPGEEYDLGSAQNTPDGPTTNSPLTITVPNNAVPGNTTMRVSARYFTPPTACEEDFDGEVEDYRIVVEDTFICSNTSSFITVSECDSYTSPSGNNTYTTSGIYQDVLPKADGCDSLILITLTITEGTSSTISPIVCDSYTVPSGNQTYLVSGTYQDIIPNSKGCDSTITINLTIPTIDTSLTATKFSLTANQSNASYQWLDCNTMTEIPGETDQVFNPQANGSYAAIITLDDCPDTTDCFVMESVGILDLSFRNNVKIYPNPSHGQFNVDLGGIYSDVKVEITDLRGKLIYTNSISQKELLTVSINQSVGIYLLKITADGKQGVFKLIKE